MDKKLTAWVTLKTVAHIISINRAEKLDSAILTTKKTIKVSDRTISILHEAAKIIPVVLEELKLKLDFVFVDGPLLVC